MWFLRISMWIARISGMLALLLGMLIWGFVTWGVQVDLTGLHMPLGLLVALGLIIFSLVGLFTPGLRITGFIGLLYALFVPYFGLNQWYVLPGSWHWLIQIAHLLVGVGAMGLTQILWTRFEGLKKAQQG